MTWDILLYILNESKQIRDLDEYIPRKGLYKKIKTKEGTTMQRNYVKGKFTALLLALLLA